MAGEVRPIEDLSPFLDMVRAAFHIPQRAGLAFLARLSFQFEEMEFWGPADLREPPLRDRLENPAMLRIVSLEALDRLPVAAEEVEIGLAVEDPLAPWNEGKFTLRVEYGRLRVLHHGHDLLPIGPWMPPEQGH